ncbi:MAG: biopolymer transporter ExbD [Nevskiaceae bacterium]|jgi:biopolymer transport protein ExbD|nr:biopolymer transporter ExbD [Nevskiaceae bacterium]
MRRNYTMRRMERRFRKPSELLLVPMIDIFTVLVTFLLMTAVFSRTVIMELKLPTGEAQFTEPPPGLELEVIVRSDMLQVADRKTGPLNTLRKADLAAPYDLAGLSEYLQFVKSRYPDLTDANLLLEKDIPYDVLVQVMDTVRILEQRQDGELVQAELFPNVSIGDAPETDAPPLAGVTP